jgi:galactose mutarotase-like enzyme
MQHQLVSEVLSAGINSFGAELCSVKNKAGKEFMWQADKNIWARHAPVLFPVVGKLKEDRFFYLGLSYTLNQHGFARDMDFDLIFKSESKLIFELKSDQKTKQNYPFDFNLQLEYELIHNQLFCRYRVKNVSNQNLYFSIGAHPGFNMETQNGEGYYLEFEKSDFSLSRLNKGFISGLKEELVLKEKKLRLSSKLFEQDAMVFENNQINRIVLSSVQSGPQVILNCKDWPNFGIWSKIDPTKPEALPFICLEPWYGIADYENHNQELIEKKGIIDLKPGQEFEAEYDISFF